MTSKKFHLQRKILVFNRSTSYNLLIIMAHRLFDQDPLFWFSALAGSGLFAIQFLMSLFGSSDGDDPGDGAMDAAKVKWLSKQALTGFLMMFGWTALACRREFALPLSWTILFGLVAGAAAIVVSGLIFKGARKLHSPGAIFDLEKAIGKEATVYQRIPKSGTGKISVSMDKMLYEIDASSLNGDEIESFSQVLISKKIDDKTLAVTPVGTP